MSGGETNRGVEERLVLPPLPVYFVSNLACQLTVKEEVLHREVVAPFVALQLNCVLKYHQWTPAVGVCQLNDLESCILRQVVLCL